MGADIGIRKVFNNMGKCKCMICKNENAMLQANVSENAVFYTCPDCGRYEIQLSPLEYEIKFDLNHLGAYLAYNGFHNDLRYFTNRSKEWCDEWRQKFDEGDRRCGQPVFLSSENVENWYPKTFAEKIDLIMLYLGNHSIHIGEGIKLSKQTLYSILFVDRFNYDSLGKYQDRDSNALSRQAQYMLDYLVEMQYIRKCSTTGWFIQDGSTTLYLKPQGYARIDSLQKNTANGKNVLVAMKFGDDTQKLREAIRKGIEDSGYLAIFIDEVQHNDFITPELLKYIKNSKFVVVDLTHKNNGAYFEEGYAMGLGKQVIQLCRQDVNLHFDVAQKNTIMWTTEEDIPKRLTNRINATID